MSQVQRGGLASATTFSMVDDTSNPGNMYKFEASRKVTHLVNNPKLNYSAIFQQRH